MRQPGADRIDEGVFESFLQALRLVLSCSMRVRTASILFSYRVLAPIAKRSLSSSCRIASIFFRSSTILRSEKNAPAHFDCLLLEVLRLRGLHVLSKTEILAWPGRLCRRFRATLE